jgi:hypothetical protein
MNDKKGIKRVSFSEYKVNSFDEMQRLRLEKEREFYHRIEMRNRANEAYRV